MAEVLERAGAALSFQTSGEGEPLVLIHEMGGSSESWTELAACLGAGYRILSYDQRGCGGSSPVSAISLDALVEDLDAVWVRSGLSQPATLAASALGAAVAVRFAARFPERVSGLVLFTPALGVPADRRAGVLAVADRIQADGVRAFVEQGLDASYPESLRTVPGRFETFVTRQFAADADSLAAWWRMLASIDLSEDIAAVGAPSLVLAGSLDVIRPPAQVARLPGCEFQLVESGHFIAAQSPELAARIIDDWMRRTPSSVPGNIP